MKSMGSEEEDDKFYYVYSCDLDTNLQVKIGTLEGDRRRPDYEELLRDPMLEFSGRWQQQCSDMYVEVQVLSGEEEIALPVTTSYKAFTTRWNWNEWLSVPVRYCDLPADATLRFTVYEPSRPQCAAVVGTTSVPIFTGERCFNQGLHDLRLTPVTSDGGCDVIGTGPTGSGPAGQTARDGTDQMERLSKLTKRHRNGQMQQVDWLDRLAFREIELINEREKRSSCALYLMIKFPKVVSKGHQYTMVYFEEGADLEEQFRTRTEIATVADDEAELENLLELKHHHLARSLRSGVTDRELKPDAVTRDQLSAVLNAPLTRPASREAQDLVWKYRFYLSSQNKALSKFIKCVNWEQNSESQQALELMARWAPIDPNQALELLGPSFTFTHPAVRTYAVSRLRQAPDEELLMYLLQLVQALRYESEESIYAGLDVSPAHSRRSSLIITSLGSSPTDAESRSGASTPSGECSPVRSPTPVPELTVPESPEQPPADLSSLLISRACRNAVVATYFYWYMLIECDELDDPAKQDIRVRKRYLAVMKRFTQALSKGGAECRATKSVLQRQQHFIGKLVKLFKTVAKESGNRRKKIEKMQALLSDRDALKFNFASFEPLPLPLDPEVRICGIVPEKATLFKSALMPARLTFVTDTGDEFVTIFKYGDDLRQDQLILQIIMLMDRLLRRENLDLKLTPYRVLATSSNHGFVQYIESSAVAEVLSTEGSILNYFRKHHPSETGPYGVSAEVMDTYIRSCAGYCVITYLLGVGDRHLDNLLLTKAGNLFHVDFGYILGRDPKPLPPPMKLSKEMVEAMGGVNSEHYQTFRKQCYTSFLHLRRHADVILHLFSLMEGANIPDIALEPDKTVRKVQDKFRLDLSDEEAVAYMQNMIDVSVTAVMAALVEQLHKFAQYWRR